MYEFSCYMYSDMQNLLTRHRIFKGNPSDVYAKLEPVLKKLKGKPTRPGSQ